MSKDDLETQCMNELFNNEEEIEREPLIHWKPIAYVDENGKIIRKLIKEEQQEWLKNKIEKQKQR